MRRIVHFRKAIVASDALLARYATSGALLDAVNAISILSTDPAAPTLVELAARHLRDAKKTARPLPPLTLGELFDLKLASYSPQQARSASSLLSAKRFFCRALGENVSVESLARAEIEKALAKFDNPETWNSRFRRLRLACNHALRQGAISSSPLDGMEPRRTVYKEPEFFRPGKAERVMRIAEAHPGAIEGAIGMRLSLGFFAGVRTAETLRARWEDLDLQGGVLRVPRPKGWTRGQKPRIVQLEKNAVEWLRLWRNWMRRHGKNVKTGQIVENERCLQGWKARWLAPCGCGWGNVEGHNAMRHTYATMHVGAFRNAPATALNLGHSGGTEILERHYLGLVTKAEASTYWRIRPAGAPLPPPEPLPGRGFRTDLRPPGPE